MSGLRLEFIGECHTLTVDEDFTFGREADLVVDSNRHMHRRLGLFRSSDRGWQLHNTGSAIPLEICDQDSSSRMTIAPGSAAPIPFRRSFIRFQAGRVRYELEAEIEATIASVADEPWDEGTATVTGSSVPLNAEQRLLLTALAEPLLIDRGFRLADLPTNRGVADRLGWTITKFNRKLDTLCSKFDKLGIPGLKGELGALASSRREHLIDHVVTVGLITQNDLPLLEGQKHTTPEEDS